MKKILIILTALAVILSSCEPETPQVDGSQTDKENVENNDKENEGTENEGTENEGTENEGTENEGTENEGNENEGEEETPELENVALNELSGKDKFIELYNPNDVEVSLEGLCLVKYDSSKEGGNSTTWTGAADMKIAAKGYVVLESSDLSDPAEEGDENYEYESENHIFKGGLSGKKNVKIELQDAEGNVLDTFTRGEEGSGWNNVENFNNEKKYTFSRVPDGTGPFVYANPTKGKANGEKVADIEQEPKVE